MADEDGNEDDRTIELSSIEASFPELRLDPSDPFAATLELPVSPANPLAVGFTDLPDTTSVNAPSQPSNSSSIGSKELEGLNTTPPNPTVHRLSYLPPLTLRIILPKGYPAAKPPRFELATDSSWMPEEKRQELQEAGCQLWEDMGRNEVVYCYIDFLLEAINDGFGLAQPNGLPVQLSSTLEPALIAYDTQAKRAKFERETFECGICLEPKKGTVCHRLQRCGHVFCVSCLQDFYNSCIAEGDVASVKCLAPNCTKDHTTNEPSTSAPRKRRRKPDRSLQPSELLQIPLEQDIVQRYVNMKRKKLIESDRNTVYCPRTWCQGAVRSTKYPKPDGLILPPIPDSDSSDEDSPSSSLPNPATAPAPADRLAICEDCSFAFCRVCHASWHGPFQSCHPRSAHDLSAEEIASQRYIEQYSQPCPKCRTRCQKLFGCNHMTCLQCRTHFCYLCSARLDPEHPYKHFNAAWSGCYHKLWEMEFGDGVDVDRGAAEAMMREREEEEEEEDGEEEGEQGDRPEGGNAIRPAGPVPGPGPGPGPVAAVAEPVRRIPFVPPRDHNERIQLLGRLFVEHHARLEARWEAANAAAAAAAAQRPREQGLQRFLQLVEVDAEDEWDSDELVEGEVEGDGDGGAGEDGADGNGKDDDGDGRGGGGNGNGNGDGIRRDREGVARLVARGDRRDERGWDIPVR